MLDFLSGMKTFIGGLVLVGGGAAGMAFGVVDPATAVLLIGNGFGVWGIGNKIERMAQAFEQEKEPAFTFSPVKEDTHVTKDH
jgi:hypothetical protein